MPYSPVLVAPMREEMTRMGARELTTGPEVDSALGDARGTTLVFVNSVCGCAAGNARPALALALRHAVPFHFVECLARPEVCRERLAHRTRSSTASDAGPAEFDVVASRYVPPTELSAGERIEIDTERSLHQSVAAVLARVRGT